MRLYLTVPEERKAVLIAIADVVVFKAGVFDCFQEMDRLYYNSISHFPTQEQTSGR